MVVISLLLILITSLPLFASSISLSSETLRLTQNDTVTVQMEVVEDGEGDFVSTPTPQFADFSLVQQGQSSSRSMSFINGKMTSKTIITYTYLLSPKKRGNLIIPRIKAKLKNGKTVTSNALSFRVANGVSSTANPLKTHSDKTEQNDADTTNKNSTLLAENPDFGSTLSPWEARTQKYFVRVFVTPLGSKTPFQRMPFEVAYYLYTKRGAISNIDVPQFPHFKNAWVEEIEKPTRLAFNTVQIGNTLYDYALLKRYLVVPESEATTLDATQLIVKISSRDFFARNKRISSIALAIPLQELPDDSQQREAVFGEFTIHPDKKEITLEKGHLIDSVSYTVRGCGNISAIPVSMKPIRGVKIFPPDVETEGTVRDNKYCGTKKVTFMIKGLELGDQKITIEPIQQFDGTTYSTITSAPTFLHVKAIATRTDSVSSQKGVHSFEFLPTLPTNLPLHQTGNPLTNRRLQAVAATPFLALLIALLILSFSTISRKKREGKIYAKQQLLKQIDAVDNSTELLNLFYKAFATLYAIDLKGMRTQQLESEMGERGNLIYQFTQSMQSRIYSGADINRDISAEKNEAKEHLTHFGGKK